MSESEFRRKLNRLRELIEERDQQIRANPLPFLKDMEKQCTELRKVLANVEYALSTDKVFDYWDQKADKAMIPQPVDLQGEALIRCNAALEVIREYRNK